MQVRISRHARRRAALYKIAVPEIEAVMRARDFSPGVSEILVTLQGIAYPVKVVVAADGGVATVVTCYPLKKGRSQ